MTYSRGMISITRSISMSKTTTTTKNNNKKQQQLISDKVLKQ